MIKVRLWKIGAAALASSVLCAAQQAGLKTLDEQLAAAESAFQKLQPDLARAQAEWEKSGALSAPVDWTISRGLVLQRRLAANGRFNGKRAIDVDLENDQVRFGWNDKFTLAAWILPASPSGVIVTRAEDIGDLAGYGLYLRNGRVQVNLVKRWPNDALSVETEDPLGFNQWRHVMMTYDGSRTADGVKIYIDGMPQKLKVQMDNLHLSFETGEPVRIGGGGASESRFQGRMHDIQIFNIALAPSEAAVLATSTPIGEIAAKSPSSRTPAESSKLRLFFLEREAPENMRAAWLELRELREQKQRIKGKSSPFG